MFAGQPLMVGRVVSLTVKVRVQVLALRAASLTVIVTVVAPRPTKAPTAGLWVLLKEPEAVKAAELLDGVKFTSEEETNIAGAANQRLNDINRLRQMPIPQDTEPAYVFKPSLPGKEPKGPATPGASSRTA